MSSIEFHVDISEAMRVLDRFERFFDEDLDDELTSLGENIVDEARSIVPVRTGYLRSTIYYERKGKHKLIVGAKAHYAGYVEYGTRKMAAQPYLRPAIARCIPNFFKRLFRRLR